ncbi:MAG: hypothetical protein HZB13_10230 [Acidobacteria bacterium]|nr:hypothetical protein [Acidobacteriota bacterium]
MGQVTSIEEAMVVLHACRHTCITRWAKHMDPFTLHVLAGHTDMNTTKRCVHPSEADIREAMDRVQKSKVHAPGRDDASRTATLLM